MAPVPNLDLMKKGLRPFSAEKEDWRKFRSSKPRPDEEGIETRESSARISSFVMSMCSKPRPDEEGIETLRPIPNAIAKSAIESSKPRPDEEGIETLYCSQCDCIPWDKIVPNLDLMKKGLRHGVFEALVYSLEAGE